jgi:hypothetical protein
MMETRTQQVNAQKERGHMLARARKVAKVSRVFEVPIALLVGISGAFAFDAPARQIVNYMQERGVAQSAAPAKEYPQGEELTSRNRGLDRHHD